jgi:hypothetical protein
VPETKRPFGGDSKWPERLELGRIMDSQAIRRMSAPISEISGIPEISGGFSGVQP